MILRNSHQPRNTLIKTCQEAAGHSNATGISAYMTGIALPSIAQPQTAAANARAHTLRTRNQAIAWRNHRTKKT